MTTYPGGIATLGPVVNGIDDVLAGDVNEAYDEIVAIETELGTDPAGSMTDVKSRLAVSLAADGDLALTGVSALTITSGAVTVTGNRHTIDTEGAASSDDLDTISGGAAGMLLWLRSTAAARNVVIKHNTGNILCPGGADITLDDLNEFALLWYDGGQSKWLATKAQGGGTIDGSGTADYIPKWGDTDTLAASIMRQGTNEIIIGTGAAGVDYKLTFNGEDSDHTFTHKEDEGYLESNQKIRTATPLYRRYFHIPLYSCDPAVAGATWTEPGVNTTGGWQLDAATEFLYFHADARTDWPGDSDPMVLVWFDVNTDNTGGEDTDTVDMKLTAFYKGVGDTAAKTQTVEVAKVIGKSAQYKSFRADFSLDHAASGNVIDPGDNLSFKLNLETDSSEVDDITITCIVFLYETAHFQKESLDVV